MGSSRRGGGLQGQGHLSHLSLPALGQSLAPGSCPRFLSSPAWFVWSLVGSFCTGPGSEGDLFITALLGGLEGEGEGKKSICVNLPQDIYLFFPLPSRTTVASLFRERSLPSNSPAGTSWLLPHPRGRGFALLPSASFLGAMCVLTHTYIYTYMPCRSLLKHVPRVTKQLAEKRS